MDEQNEIIAELCSQLLEEGQLTDYEVPRIDQSEDPLTHFALFADYDPLIFQEAVKDSKWQNAMDEEMRFIEKNNTWELVELLNGNKSIGVK